MTKGETVSDNVSDIETFRERADRLIAERIDTIDDIRASHDLTSDEVLAYAGERLRLVTARGSFDWDDDQALLILGLIDAEDENLKWS